MFSCGWHHESSGSGAHGVVVSHPLRMRKTLGSTPSVSMHSMLHAPWLEKDFSRPPATSTDSVSAVLFVGLVSWLSIPLSARGSVFVQKNSLNHPASIFPLLRTCVPDFLAERVSQKLRGMFSCGWHHESSGSGAHGVVVSHPLRMQKALGSIPSVSMHSMLHAPWLEKDVSRPPATSTDSVSAVLFVGLVSCLSIPLSARAREGSTLQNAGRDDLGGFSTPILLSCFCSKKCSKSSRVHFPIAEDVYTWCSGITSASHAEGPGLSPQCVHAQHAACSLAGERLLSSSCHLHRQRFSCAVCRPCILLVHTAVCTWLGRAVLCKMQGGMI